MFTLLVSRFEISLKRSWRLITRLIGGLRLITRLVQQDWYSHDTTILLQPCIVNFLSILLQQVSNGSKRGKIAVCQQAASHLCLHCLCQVRTKNSLVCSKKSLIQTRCNKIVINLTIQGCNKNCYMMIVFVPTTWNKLYENNLSIACKQAWYNSFAGLLQLRVFTCVSGTVTVV